MTASGLVPPPLSVVDVRRLANDSIRDLMQRLESGDAPADFLCECGDLRCDRRVSLTLDEYDATDAGAVRAH